MPRTDEDASRSFVLGLYLMSSFRSPMDRSRMECGPRPCRDPCSRCCIDEAAVLSLCSAVWQGSTDT